jgi:hypothetical protein
MSVTSSRMHGLATFGTHLQHPQQSATPIRIQKRQMLQML